jgi:hypothetical protein
LAGRVPSAAARKQEVMTPISDVRRTPLSDEQITQTVLEVLDEPRSINTQLFENSDLHDDPVVEAEQNDPDRLFATAGHPYAHDRPNLAILAEKPEHRIIVYLKAQGLSNKEVAEKTGFTYHWVSQIVRQPWFRLRLVQELKDAGIDQISSVLKSSALDSVFTLIDLRDDPVAPKAVRSSCANSLLDRFLGKAVQKVESTETKLPHTTEIAAVEKELAEVDKLLGVNNGNKEQTTQVEST